METYRVSFFGHRKVENALQIEQDLEKIIADLLYQHSYVEFLVGRDGEFDQLVSSIIHRCKRNIRSDNSAHIWVLPYITAEYRENEQFYLDYYDEITVCDEASMAHFKAAYQVRNRRMIDRSDFVIFCVQHEKGGAWQTMKYARRKGIPYLNLNDKLEINNEKFCNK